MRYRTEITGSRNYEDVYECRDCGSTYDSYHQLHHPTADSGGFCGYCKSDDVVVMVKKTVYAEVWVREDEELHDILEVAEQVDDWQVADHTIRITGEKK